MSPHVVHELVLKVKDVKVLTLQKFYTVGWGCGFRLGLGARQFRAI